MKVPALAAGVAAALALPSAAQAVDYCVTPASSCAPADTFTAVEDALAAADASDGLDRVLIGAGTFTAPSTAGYEYDNPSFGVEIIGAGASQTRLTGPTDTGSVLDVTATGPDTLISDLEVRLPASSTIDTKMGLRFKGTARRVLVTADPGLTSVGIGVAIFPGSVFEQGEVSLPFDTSKLGVTTMGADATLRDTTITSRNGVQIQHTGAVYERIDVSTSSLGLRMGNVTDGVVRNSIFRVLGASTGLRVGTNNNTDAGLLADHLTIVGDGDPGSIGAVSDSNNPFVASLRLRNSIVRNVGQSLSRTASAGTADLTVSHSDFPPTITQSGTGTLDTSTGNIDADPLFVNLAAGDLRLLEGSPAVDAGDPALTLPDDDFAGAARPADGNGDGVAVRDMGAYEGTVPAPDAAAGPPAGGPPSLAALLDLSAPGVANFRADPSSFAVGRAATPLVARTRRGTRFRYSLSEAARVTIRIERALPGRRVGRRCRRPSRRLRGRRRCTRWRLAGTLTRAGASGSNTTPFSGRLGRRALRLGRYRALIAAADLAGNVSVRRTARFRVVRG